MFGCSSPFTVLARSKIGVYCRISTALKRVFHDWVSCNDDRSLEASVQCIIKSSLISTQRRFLAASDSLFIFLLSLFPRQWR